MNINNIQKQLFEIKELKEVSYLMNSFFKKLFIFLMFQ